MVLGEIGQRGGRAGNERTGFLRNCPVLPSPPEFNAFEKVSLDRSGGVAAEDPTRSTSHDPHWPLFSCLPALSIPAQLLSTRSTRDPVGEGKS